MHPLESAFLVQLVYENKDLLRQIQSQCADASRSIEAGNIENLSALKCAASIFKSLVDWTAAATISKDVSIESRAPITTQCYNLHLLPSAPPLLGTDDSSKMPKSSQSKDKKTKIFCDGVFDLMHSGHFNALRHASKLGDELYVGICSDEEVLKAKGVYPLYTVDERAELVTACKWVTGVIKNSPYDIDFNYFKTTGCDYVAHGDDMALNADGIDCYEEIRKAGYLKIFKRTEGISTTTLVARLLGESYALLRAVVDSVQARGLDVPAPIRATEYTGQLLLKNNAPFHQLDEESDHEMINYEMRKTYLSSRRLLEFIKPTKNPPIQSKIVYLDGSFDVLHTGHVHLIEKAKSLGDFLIVGVYDDPVVRELKGPGFPIQGMLDRALSVLAMRHVDELILGVPLNPTEHLMKAYKVSLFVRGTTKDPNTTRRQSPSDQLEGVCECVTVESNSSFTTQTVIDRIIRNREKLKTSIATRQIKEKNYQATEYN